jgi:uncharacterized protein YneF (UPF0154 family)
MKKFLIGLTTLLIAGFDLYLIAAGVFTLFTGSANLFEAIVFIGMGLILAFCIGITFFVANVTMESTKINAELLQMVVQMQMQNRGQAPTNPLSMLSNLLKGFPGTMGGPDSEASIQILGTDENGNIKPMAEHTFKPGEDKDEVLAKMLNIAFGKEKPAKKAIEEMGLEELKAELEKALSEEKYEKASLLRNKINELEKK